MNNKIATCFVIMFTLAISQANAGLLRAWEGVWQDDNGGIITIREKDGFLDISGKDKESIYTCTCLIDNNDVAKCIGEGVNHTEGFRFLYQSKMTREKNGNLIKGTWEALFKGGSRNGKATFSGRAKDVTISK